MASEMKKLWMWLRTWTLAGLGLIVVSEIVNFFTQYTWNIDVFPIKAGLSLDWTPIGMFWMLIALIWKSIILGVLVELGARASKWINTHIFKVLGV